MYDLDGLDCRDEAVTKYRDLFTKFPDNLLSIGADPKTVKGEAHGWLTAILYLLPSDLSGVNLCPMAKIAKCSDPCLNTAGRGKMTSVKMSRLRKTLYYNQWYPDFERQLIAELEKFATTRPELQKAVRLNGLSDIRWERKVWDTMTHLYDLHGVQFYDYTKLANRHIKRPEVYDLTFSYSGVSDYRLYVEQAVRRGYRMSVVFNGSLPETFLGRTVVNGDENDLVFRHPNDVIVGLKAKGPARYDTSGFVVHV
jgi:hypothetical protein